MPSIASTRSVRPLWPLIVACLVAAAHLFNFTFFSDRAYQSFDKALHPVSDFPRLDGGNKRFYLDNDPYCWISYAREMAQTGQWRTRYTYMDNVPFGREVHWSQSISWLLVVFGSVRHLCTGESMVDAIDGAAIWVNPFLWFVFAAGFSWLIARRMGAVAGVFFALTFVTLPDVAWTFHPFHLGHHGLHVACSLGTVLCLVLGGLGWVTKENAQLSEDRNSQSAMSFFRPLNVVCRAEARRYFAAAGVFTGLGLWIGATVQFFSIGALAVGSVLLAFFMPAHLTDERVDYVPELWRTWAAWAAIVGIFFYLVEYFPSHLAMRLEVNNPLYAFTVVCVGELVVRLTRRRLGAQPVKKLDWFWIALAAAGVALVPALITLGPLAWYTVRDPEMMRLHNFILEFYTYLKFHPHEPLGTFFHANGLVPLFLIGALLLSGPGRSRLYEWAALWVSFFVCLFFLLLTWWQVRWGWHYAVMSIWLMILVGHIAWRNVLAPKGKRPGIEFVAVISAAVLIQGVAFAVREYVGMSAIRNRKILTSDLMDAAMRKHLAQDWGALNRNKQFRFVCEPDLAPALYYFGGIRSVTSYYWENDDGLHAATEFFTDHGDTAARRVAQERGLTHVLVSSDNTLPAIFNYIKTGNRTVAAAQPTLLDRLRRSSPNTPSWIEPDVALTKIGLRKFVYEGQSKRIPLESRFRVFRLQSNGPESAGADAGDPRTTDGTTTFRPNP